MQLTIKRLDYTFDRTLGSLWHDHNPLGLTLEDGWKSNRPNLSCIPKGIYKCTRHSGLRFHNTWKVNDVPGRSAILFHIGNNEDDTEGCILLGRRFGKLHGHDAVLDSGKAILELMKLTAPLDYFILKIEGEY